MAYRRLRITSDGSGNGSYGFKTITLEEYFTATGSGDSLVSAEQHAANRIAVIKAAPYTGIAASASTTATSFTDFTSTTGANVTLESWSITEKTRVFQVDEDGNEITASSTKPAVDTDTSTHVVLKYVLKLADFWTK